MDVGSNMCRHSNSTELVENCIDGIIRLVEKKILFYPKDEVGLVLFGSKDTKNRLAESSAGSYRHVKVIRSITYPDVALLRELRQVKPEGSKSDFVDALIVGIDMMTDIEQRKGVKPNLRLFLVTDAAGEANIADLDLIVDKMVEMKISLNVVGVDFEEEEEIPEIDSVEKKLKMEIDHETGNRMDITPIPSGTNPTGTASTSTTMGYNDESSPPSISIKKEPIETSQSSSTAVAVTVPQPTANNNHIKRLISHLGSESSKNEDERKKDTFLIRKRGNEKVLKQICDRVTGTIVPVHQALDLMNYFDSKSVSPNSNFRGFLSISDVVEIPVWGYVKTKEANFPKLISISKISSESTSNSLNPPANQERDNQMQIEKTMGIVTETSYYSTDNLDQMIEKDQLQRAYKYGKTFVPSDASIIPYKTTSCLKVLGFTSKESVPRHFFTSNTECIVPYGGDTHASQAISALCHAMETTGTVAIVRSVKRNNAVPMLGVLSPHFTVDYENLWLNRLPFNDDIRMYGFISLVETENSPEVPSWAQPNQRQLDVTEDLINAMDLSTAAVNVFGEPMQALKPKNTFNPTLQYFYQLVLARALKPSSSNLAPINPNIVQQVSTSENFNAMASSAIGKFRDAFSLTKTEYKDKLSKKRNWSEAFGDGSGSGSGGGAGGTNGDSRFDDKLDSYLNEDAKKSKKSDSNHPIGLTNINALLRGGVEEVGNLTPVEDFEAMISRKDADLVDKAISQMEQQILKIVNDSVKNSHYSKAIDSLKSLRNGCIQQSESAEFNRFLHTLKSSFNGQTRDDFWKLMQQQSITLISNNEDSECDTTEEEAKEFFTSASKENQSSNSLQPSGPKPSSSKPAEDAAEDLFDLL